MKHLTSLLLIAITWTASAQESCPNLFDSNSNGAVDIEDFLAVLSLFSDVDSDSDGIWDSQDACSASCGLQPLKTGTIESQTIHTLWTQQDRSRTPSTLTWWCESIKAQPSNLVAPP